MNPKKLPAIFVESHPSPLGRIWFASDDVGVVGQANGRNPVPLLIPCHRVIATGGGLGGYSAGIEKKRFLLEWERGTRAGRS